MSIAKPSHEEEEYFARQEMDKKKAFAENLKAQMQTEEVDKLKKTHWMHCGKCGFEMHSVVFKGITIDKCPHCGAILLGAEELEQLAGQEGQFIGNVLGLFKF